MGYQKLFCRASSSPHREDMDPKGDRRCVAASGLFLEIFHTVFNIHFNFTSLSLIAVSQLPLYTHELSISMSNTWFHSILENP